MGQNYQTHLKIKVINNQLIDVKGICLDGNISHGANKKTVWNWEYSCPCIKIIKKSDKAPKNQYKIKEFI